MLQNENFATLFCRLSEGNLLYLVNLKIIPDTRRADAIVSERFLIFFVKVAFMNPYSVDPNQSYSAPPSDMISGNDGTQFNPQGNQLGAGSATNWFSVGFGSFKAAPGVWIGMALIHFVIAIVLGIIPLGSIASYILMPVFTAGFMLACQAQFEGKPIGVDMMFAGFKEKFGSLALLGLFWLIGIFLIAAVIGIVVAITIGGAVATSALSGGNVASAIFGLGFGTILLLFIVAVIAFIPVAMAISFAPALVVFHNVEPFEALKLSLKASLKNWGAFFLYVILTIILGVLASLPLFLGWLILWPTMIGAMYGAYREIFLVPANKAASM